MLFRVQVYPHDPNFVPEASNVSAGTVAAALSGPPASTLFPSLGTIQDEGKLLSIGRKVGDVVLNADKSVSREHAVLRVVSANKTSHVAIIAPRNDREVQACRDNAADQHMAVVLETIGRCGCYVLYKKRRQKAEKADDDSVTDDEIEPSGQQPSGSQSSAITDGSTNTLLAMAERMGFQRDQVEVKFAGPEQTLILPSLQPSQSDDLLILQCGKLGSLLVLQRLEFRIFTSGSTYKTLFKNQAHRLNALGVYEESESVLNATHLCCASRTASPTQLAAWCRGGGGIEFVTNAYLQAHLDERKSVQDAPPKADDYQPKSDGNDFWNETVPTNFWRQWTFLSTSAADRDLESMVQAAGATVVTLYQSDTGDTPSLEAQVERATAIFRAHRSTCFTVHHASRKLTKRLKALSVPIYTNKHLAKQLVALKLPDGSNPADETILACEQQNCDEQMPAASPPLQSQAASGATQQEAIAIDDDGDSDDDDDFDLSGAVAAASQASREAAASQQAAKKPAAATKKPPSAASQTSREATASQEQQQQAKKPSAKPPSAAAAAPKSTVRRETQPETQQLESQAPAPPRSTRKTRSTPCRRDKANEPPPPQEKDKEDEQPPPVEEQPVVEEEEEQEAEKPKPRREPSPPPPPKDGWYAAPRGNKRKARPKSEMLQEYQNRIGGGNENDDNKMELIQVAPTDTCKGLIVKQPQQKKKKKTSSYNTGPDYKRFCKNKVPAGAGAAPNIKFYSVLPNEASQQAQAFLLESTQQQAEWEEQQRRADELFSEAATGAGRGTRRGGGGGGGRTRTRR